MLGYQARAPKRAREEGEKPFWISFSDLMSALMVLFLVAMTVALLAVTKKTSDAEREERERTESIQALMGEIKRVVDTKEFEGIQVTDNTIDFGPRGTFEKEGQNVLSVPQQQMLRSFTPVLLDKLRQSEAGKKWFKRAVVEGYASQTGTYLYNLNLSLERSGRVLCELLRAAPTPADTLSLEDRKLIATKFFVGGGVIQLAARRRHQPAHRVQARIQDAAGA
jgi:hypothetical protein